MRSQRAFLMPSYREVAEAIAPEEEEEGEETDEDEEEWLEETEAIH